MKYFLTFLLFASIKFTAYSQFYLGLPYKEAIKLIVKDAGVVPEYRAGGDKNYALTWSANKAEINFDAAVYFDKQSNISNLYLIVPNDTKTLSSFIKVFNNDYVLEKEDVWLCHSQGKKVRISLLYSKETGKYSIFFNLQNQ